MQIKTLLHNKGFALSLVLKVRVSGTRKWPIHQAKKSVGPVCLTRALNIQIRIRQNTYSNRAIGKTIRFVKELSLAIIVSSSVDWYDHFWSTACCMSLAAQVASRYAQWREVRLHLITGTPNDLILQNNCYKAANLYYLEISKAPERLKISG